MTSRDEFAENLANVLGAQSQEIAEAKAEDFCQRYEIETESAESIKEIFQFAFIAGCKHGYAACLQSMKQIKQYVEGPDYDAE